MKLFFNLTLLTFGLLLVSSCATVLNVDQNQLLYRSKLNIDITEVKRNYGQNAWGNRTLVPPRGHDFVYLTLKVSNPTEEDAEIDFTEIFLVDPVSKTKYPVGRIYVSTTVMVTGRDAITVKKKDDLKRILMYSFPKSKKPEFLEVEGEMHRINYKAE